MDGALAPGHQLKIQAACGMAAYVHQLFVGSRVTSITALSDQKDVVWVTHAQGDRFGQTLFAMLRRFVRRVMPSPP